MEFTNPSLAYYNQIIMMKSSFFQSISGVLFLSLSLALLAPVYTDAQLALPKKKVVTPVKHYNSKPRRGSHVTALPRRTVVVTHRNFPYHYRDGVFDRTVRNSYVVTAPPIGIRVATLPPNPYRVALAGRTYYYYYGTYYLPAANGYEVVPPPIGARIDALPDGYEVFELDGLVYYQLEETYYKAVLEPNGQVVYEVVRV